MTGDVSVFGWATVVSVNPLSVRRDGETAPLGVSPFSLVDTSRLAVGDRVWIQLVDRRALILGVGGGPRLPYRIAVGYVDMAGTGTKTVTLPAGVFDRAPIVTISGAQATQSPAQDVRAYDATATSFVVLYQRADAWNTSHTGTRRFAWHALQTEI